MIPFDPQSPHVFWYQACQRHIRAAKSNPAMREGYCRAACIARVMYETYLALEKVRIHDA